MPRHKMPDAVKQYFVRMGRKGGKLGGKIRAAHLSAEERSEAARKAVLVRWNKRKHQ